MSWRSFLSIPQDQHLAGDVSRDDQIPSNSGDVLVPGLLRMRKRL